MHRIAVGIAAAVLILGTAGCGISENEEAEQSTAALQVKNEALLSEEKEESSPETENMEEAGMRISVKSSEYEIIYELNESGAAQDLLEQLPLTVETEPFSNNEITFYPPEKLDTGNTPLGSGEAGTLAYYAPCAPNSSLFELGRAVSGEENVADLAGTVTVSVFEE